MEKLIKYLSLLGLCCLLALGVVYGTHFWIIATFEYGWQYNETTLPILVQWSIFFRIIIVDMIIAIPIGIIIFILVCIWLYIH